MMEVSIGFDGAELEVGNALLDIVVVFTGCSSAYALEPGMGLARWGGAVEAAGGSEPVFGSPVASFVELSNERDLIL